MPVNTPCAEYTHYVPRWKRILDALGGASRVKDLTTEYLPTLGGEKENDSSYKLRLDLAKWYDSPLRTVEMLSGLLMRKDPMIDGEKDEKTEYLINDVTLSGVSMVTFIARIITNVISYARYGVLVDYSVEEERPYLVGYGPSNIINWRQEKVGSSFKTTLVVLREILEQPKPDDNFVTEEIEQYRVLALDPDGYYYRQVWTRTSAKNTKNFTADDPVYPSRRGEKFTYIPFTFFGKTDLDPDTERSPIEAIVDLAFHYYQLSADFFWGLHFTALPTPVVINAGENVPDTLGPTEIWTINGENADAKMLSFTGDGMSLLHEAGLEADKQEMADLGARLLESKSASNVAARTVEIKSNTDSASLSSIASNISVGMTSIYALMHWWLFLPTEEVSVEINKDFLPDLLDPQMLRELIAAMQAGTLSKRDLFEQFKRGEIVAGDKTFDEHEEELRQDNDDLMSMERDIFDRDTIETEE